jgi:8-oxo-dGTP pyrophosphatase MutT (NUDIX family)
MRAVGALIISQSTQRVLMQLRSPKESYGLSWGLWGGKLNSNEGDLNGLKRELCEELGYPGVPDTVAMSHVYTFVSRDNRFRHVSYLILCKDEFIPTLDHESSGYCWVDIWRWPQPLHRNTAKMFSSRGFKNALEGLLRDDKAS